jgi:hypothetical protein
MLSEQEKYTILDTLNEQLQSIICNLNPNPFRNITLAELDTTIASLSPARITQLQSIAQNLEKAETKLIEESIAGKRRLKKADVLEWDVENPDLSQNRSHGELKSSLAARIRLILGLKSIAQLMADNLPGQSQASNQARLYRS